MKRIRPMVRTSIPSVPIKSTKEIPGEFACNKNIVKLNIDLIQNKHGAFQWNFL